MAGEIPPDLVRCLIIHSDIAERALRGEEGFCNPAFEDQFRPHVALIGEVRQRPGTVELTHDQDPTRAAQSFKPGEVAIIYGLWDSCVTEAVEALENIPVNIELGPEPFATLPWHSLHR